MITIGYISDIKYDDVYVTYSHVDKDICFRTKANYHIGDIVAVELETKRDTYIQAVDRTINSTAINAKTNYSKVEHLSHLLKEILFIKQLYESEKVRVHKESERYLGYSFTK